MQSWNILAVQTQFLYLIKRAFYTAFGGHYTGSITSNNGLYKVPAARWFYDEHAKHGFRDLETGLTPKLIAQELLDHLSGYARESGNFQMRSDEFGTLELSLTDKYLFGNISNILKHRSYSVMRVHPEIPMLDAQTSVVLPDSPMTLREYRRYQTAREYGHVLQTQGTRVEWHEQGRFLNEDSAMGQCILSINLEDEAYYVQRLQHRGQPQYLRVGNIIPEIQLSQFNHEDKLKFIDIFNSYQPQKSISLLDYQPDPNLSSPLTIPDDLLMVHIADLFQQFRFPELRLLIKQRSTRQIDPSTTSQLITPIPHLGQILTKFYREHCCLQNGI